MLGDLPAARTALETFVRELPSIPTWRPPGPIWEMSVWDWKICPRPGPLTSDRWPTSLEANLPIALGMGWAERSRIWAKSIWPSRFFPS